jgi:hypothetical protein
VDNFPQIGGLNREEVRRISAELNEFLFFMVQDDHRFATRLTVI